MYQLPRLPDIEDLLSLMPSKVPGGIVRAAFKLFDTRAALFLLDIDRTILHLTAAYPAVTSAPSLKITEQLLDQVTLERRTVAAPREEWSERIPLREAHLAAAPVKVRDTVTGMLIIEGPEPFSSEDLTLLKALGVQAGAALSVADRYTDTIRMSRQRANPSIAAELQQELLPPSELYTPLVNVAGGIEPAYDVGGDWFDYALNHNKLFVAVCDAVGRGLKAEAIAAMTLGAVRNARRNGESLPAIMSLVHRTITQVTSLDQFATLLLAEIDLTTQEMQLVNAGHPEPVYISQDSTRAPVPVPITCTYPPLGAFSEDQAYAVQRHPLEPGSRLVFLSDGVLERRDNGRKPLGVQGLLHIAAYYRQLKPMAFTHSLLGKVVSYSEAPIEDDATVVTLDLAGGDRFLLNSGPFENPLPNR